MKEIEDDLRLYNISDMLYRNTKMKEIEDYLRQARKVTIPEIQEKFGLTYKVTRELFTQFLGEDILEVEDELYFKYKDFDEELFKKVLWDCIKSGSLNLLAIQNNFDISSNTALRIIKRMEEKNYLTIGRHRHVSLTKEEFVEIYGEMENEEEEEEDVLNSIKKDGTFDFRKKFS